MNWREKKKKKKRETIANIDREKTYWKREESKRDNIFHLV
jgi:hypothetical protein